MYLSSRKSRRLLLITITFFRYWNVKVFCPLCYSLKRQFCRILADDPKLLSNFAVIYLSSSKGINFLMVWVNELRRVDIFSITLMVNLLNYRLNIYHIWRYSHTVFSRIHTKFRTSRIDDSIDVWLFLQLYSLTRQDSMVYFIECQSF